MCSNVYIYIYIYIYIPSFCFMSSCPFCFCCQIVLGDVRQFMFLFPWNSSNDLIFEYVIRACILISCVWLGVYVDFPYHMLMLFYVGLRACDIFYVENVIIRGCNWNKAVTKNVTV
jgi:hypothetical protein